MKTVKIIIKSKCLKSNTGILIGIDNVTDIDKTPTIDNVDINTLDLALRVCDISIPLSILDKIIDVVELLEHKGDKTTIDDILKLKREWKQINSENNESNTI